MKKLLLSTCIATALVACSNGGGSDKSETTQLTEEQKAAVEETFNLPPEPDVDENNETVLGVDSNDNGVRDDVERELTFKYHKEPIVLKIQLDAAKEKSKLLELVESDLSEISKEEFLAKVDEVYFSRECIIKYYGSARAALPVLRELSGLIVNTRERLIANDKIAAKLSGSIIGNSSDEEIAEGCAKYYNVK